MKKKEEICIPAAQTAAQSDGASQGVFQTGVSAACRPETRCLHMAFNIKWLGDTRKIKSETDPKNEVR